MDAAGLGRGLLYLGLGLVVVGGLIIFLAQIIDVGNLPGDFLYEGRNVKIYVPLGTMVVLSILLTLLLNLALKLFR